MGGMHRWAQTRFLPQRVPGLCHDLCHPTRTSPILWGPTWQWGGLAWPVASTASFAVLSSDLPEPCVLLQENGKCLTRAG